MSLTPLLFALSACNNSVVDSAEETQTDSQDSTTEVDLTDAVLTERSGDCADHASEAFALVQDIQRALGFEADVDIRLTETHCVITSNNIPNHDFNDDSARFATDVAEVDRSFEIPRDPTLAASASALSQGTYNGVILNGVPLDIRSAGCYDPDAPDADVNGDVSIGCTDDADWLLDPLSTDHKFGADAHNAHTQPDGSYHYHGSPEALFDDNPGEEGSPVIGFAADGFPIYGSYFKDESGTVRKAVSGYTLKSGTRPDTEGNPGGTYTGRYVQDWEYTEAGDLDACNGMSVDGQYGYYITDSYPWVLACFSGAADPSFNKTGG